MMHVDEDDDDDDEDVAEAKPKGNLKLNWLRTLAHFHPPQVKAGFNLPEDDLYRQIHCVDYPGTFSFSFSAFLHVPGALKSYALIRSGLLEEQTGRTSAASRPNRSP